MKSRILVVYGTRPEAIKMVPVIQALREHPNFFDVKVCVTGQHREMLDQVDRLFAIKPDFDLDIMNRSAGGGNLSDVTTSILSRIGQVFAEYKPHRVLVHGDTATAFSACLAAFHNKIPVGHVEAGLRSLDASSPWPEETYRTLIADIADLHFAPSRDAKMNLLKEGVPSNRIRVTGNSVIDSLYLVRDSIRSDNFQRKILNRQFRFLDPDKKLILLTCHRRENFGAPIKNILEAAVELVSKFADVEVVLPLHLNPHVRQVAKDIVGDEKRPLVKGIHVVEPLDYVSFVYLMTKSYLIMSDSGGLQEEAPALGIPMLLLRDVADRAESVRSGAVKIAGVEKKGIIASATALLKNKVTYDRMSKRGSAYGNGHSSRKIALELAKRHMHLIKSRDKSFPTTSVPLSRGQFPRAA